jgi:hypothetical protein
MFTLKEIDAADELFLRRKSFYCPHQTLAGCVTSDGHLQQTVKAVEWTRKRGLEKL